MCDIAAECWNLGLSDSTGFSISAKIPNPPAILVDKSGTGKDIPTYTLQSKLIGKVRCIKVDDRKEKEYFFKNQPQFDVPSGVYTRPDVLWSMNKVADKAADIIMEKGDELEKHGIVISQFEHGFFAWGRTVDEAFENAYRARRNAQALLLSKLS